MLAEFIADLKSSNKETGGGAFAFKIFAGAERRGLYFDFDRFEPMNSPII